MAARICVITALCMIASAAPPAPPRLFPPHGPSQLQQINPLDYYLHNPEVPNYYQAQQKQENINSNSNGAPSRLETLEPDSEVELIPGAQQPQIPQQTPVSPGLPGLVPGQRVFIVHMPVPGYRVNSTGDPKAGHYLAQRISLAIQRGNAASMLGTLPQRPNLYNMLNIPGTIGGYQPVYIVSAAPQGNTAYPANGVPGYQNGILLSPSGQAVIPSVLGYARQPGLNVVPQSANSGVLLGAPLLNRPFELVYPEPTFAYQPVPVPQGAEGTKGTVRFSQLVALQTQPNQPSDHTGQNEAPSNAEPKRLGEVSGEPKENDDEARRNTRPAQPHVLGRNKV